MLKTFVLAFVVSATMIGTSGAFCQEPAPRRPKPNPGPDQRDEIAKLTRSVPSFGRDRGTTIPPPNQTTPTADRFRQIVEEANKRAEETREKILAVLTPEQKAKWSEMTGETFQCTTPQQSAPHGTSTRSSEPAKPGAEKKNQKPRQAQKTWQDVEFGKDVI